MDTGLGSAYERWAIYALLERWLGPLHLASAAEGPFDGMAGMPGLHLLPLARRGVSVTVIHPDAEARERVRRVYRSAGLLHRLTLRAEEGARADAQLVFNAAHQVDDWRRHLAETAARAERWLIVFATHPRSYGVVVRRVLRKLEPGEAAREQFDHESCRPEVMRRALAPLGEIVAEAYVDCPWWPDLFVSPGESLLSASLSRFRGGPRTARPSRWDFPPAAFPFARETRPPIIADALRRHPSFERAPPLVAGWFAHPRASLVRRSAREPVNGSGGTDEVL